MPEEADLIAAYEAGGDAAAMKNPRVPPSYRSDEERQRWFAGFDRNVANRRPVTHNEYE